MLSLGSAFRSGGGPLNLRSKRNPSRTPLRAIPEWHCTSSERENWRSDGQLSLPVRTFSFLGIGLRFAQGR